MKVKEEMDNLKQLVLRMSDEVIINITEAIDFYLGKNNVDSINDDLIDQYERLIEEMCINILLKERLFAKDLKEVTGVLKLVSDLERIGDHAEDILQFAKKLKNYSKKRLNDVIDLSAFVIKMIQDSIKEYIDGDFNLANKVIEEDDVVDKKYMEIIESLTKKDSSEDYLPYAIYTTLVVKYLERIADHSVNIAEWVVYISSGYYKDKMMF